MFVRAGAASGTLFMLLGTIQTASSLAFLSSPVASALPEAGPCLLFALSSALVKA